MILRINHSLLCFLFSVVMCSSSAVADPGEVIAALCNYLEVGSGIESFGDDFPDYPPPENPFDHPLSVTACKKALDEAADRCKTRLGGTPVPGPQLPTVSYWADNRTIECRWWIGCVVTCPYERPKTIIR